MVKNALTAIKSKWLINLIACILLALLFSAELNMYFTIFYNEYIDEENNETYFSDSSYSFVFSGDVNQSDIDFILNSLSGVLSEYEDVVLSAKLSDEEGFSREILCFYGKVSNKHDFRSAVTHERFDNNVFEQGDLLVTNTVIFSDSYELNGRKYKLMQQVSDLGVYALSDLPFFCSPEEYFSITGKVNRITFEYNTSLVGDDLDKLVAIVASKVSINSVLKPLSVNERAIEIIGLSYVRLLTCFVIMIVITTCVIPIIRYCLWLRRYEFRSYRVCGADASYITFCEVSHVAILGLLAVIIGCIISIKTLFTEGFWIMLLITVALFILRLLAEILISGKSNENIVEVNERWR